MRRSSRWRRLSVAAGVEKVQHGRERVPPVVVGEHSGMQAQRIVLLQVLCDAHLAMDEIPRADIAAHEPDDDQFAGDGATGCCGRSG